MPRNKVYAIVEGHGEAKAPHKKQQPAVTILIAKLLYDLECHALFPAGRQPWRMRSQGDFFAGEKLEHVIRAHKRFQDCAAVLILVDLDDGCPRNEAPLLAKRIRDMEPPFSVVVVCATREYEAWFLASLETIHPGHTYPGDPESVRDAKGWLRREFGYRERRDQAHYTQALDVTLARERSRSFRRLYHAFEELVSARESGRSIITP
jgi:hypothetical protein